MSKGIAILLVLTLALCQSYAGERRSITGPVLLGTGIALVASGFVGMQSASAWQPMIDRQQELIDDLRDGGYDTSEAISLKSDLESSKDNIKTAAVVCVGAGVVSAIIGIVKIENDRHVRVVPVVTKEEARLSLGFGF